jgi:simple sugar transport system ATP-binding protein
MNNAAIKAEAAAKMERFDVRPPNPKLAARNFSGGNQQKIVLAREIERNPDILLVGQPTRGVDIGAIEFIHQQIIRLRDEGKAILLVSVELDEIFSLSDRIAVMFDGQIMGERIPSETNEQELGLLMAGITDTAHATMPASPMAMTEEEVQEAAEADAPEVAADGQDRAPVETETVAPEVPAEEQATEITTEPEASEDAMVTEDVAAPDPDSPPPTEPEEESSTVSTAPVDVETPPAKMDSISIGGFSATIQQSTPERPKTPDTKKDPEESEKNG